MKQYSSMRVGKTLPCSAVDFCCLCLLSCTVRGPHWRRKQAWPVGSTLPRCALQAVGWTANQHRLRVSSLVLNEWGLWCVCTLHNYGLCIAVHEMGSVLSYFMAIVSEWHQSQRAGKHWLLIKAFSYLKFYWTIWDFVKRWGTQPTLYCVQPIRCTQEGISSANLFAVLWLLPMYERQCEPHAAF